MSLLIRGGVVIDTVPSPYVTGHTDLLVEDGLISAVGTGLPAPAGAEVIDATGRLVLPGFVDTHRHTWQAAVRSIAPDISFSGYLERVLGSLAPRYRPEDVYAGDLAGALECLDAGITTLVDWSHIQLTPAHTEATVEALRRSGVRAVLGYCYGGPPTPGPPGRPGRRVREAYSDGPLFTLAIAALGPEIAGESLAWHEWRLADDLGLPVTVHMGGHGAESAERGLAFLRENGLLRPGTTYVHPNHYSDEALKEIAGSGGTASVSPVIEAELGIGHPATGRARAAGVPIGLSADAVTSGPGDMFSLMRAAYVLERARPGGESFTTRDVLRMATIEGAEVAGLGAVTGSLRVGKQADLVLLRTDTLAMAPATDPIGAIVLSADTSCVDTVLVAGRVVKRNGRLLGHDVPSILTSLNESTAHLTS